MKLKINKDVRFGSYANLPIGHYFAHPPLVSVKQFSYLQGNKAMEIMLKLLIKDKAATENLVYHKIILEPQLVLHK